MRSGGVAVCGANGGGWGGMWGPGGPTRVTLLPLPPSAGGGMRVGPQYQAVVPDFDPGKSLLSFWWGGRLTHLIHRFGTPWAPLVCASKIISPNSSPQHPEQEQGPPPFPPPPPHHTRLIKEVSMLSRGRFAGREEQGSWQG